MGAPSTPLGAPSSPPREARPKPTAPKPQKLGPARTARATGSEGARKTAATILEVLAGARSTIDAAKALAVSLPRYYQLEARAITAMVEGLEPRPSGRKATVERELAALRKEKARLERECTRCQALARTTQRALGLVPPPKVVSDPKGKKDGSEKRRVQRVLARGIRAASVLRGDADEAAPKTPAASSSGGVA